MENSENVQSLKIELNNTLSSNVNNFINNKNNQREDNSSNNKLKKGEFILTPLEGFILNKKMPLGFKFEIMENIKLLDANYNMHKKVKLTERFSERQKHVKIAKNQMNEPKNNSNLNKELLSNNKKLKKIIKENENSPDNNINNNYEPNIIMMKCYWGFNKIKSNPNSNFFYLSKTPDSPSLSKIEKKIKNLEYKTINDFCDDLRKLWNYEFKNYSKNPNIYQNICIMSTLSDQICKDLFNENINNYKNEDLLNLSNKKKLEKSKSNLDEKKVNTKNIIPNKNIKQRSMEEINRLSQLIRTLNKLELKGIIPIIFDNKEKNDSKEYIFDLEQLPNDKFKRLQEYVHNCRKNKNPLIDNNSNIELNKEINNNLNNNINTKDSELKNRIITNNNKYSNIKDTNSFINNNQILNNKEEKKYSDSDSMSSYSSLSN